MRALFRCTQPNRLFNHLLDHFKFETDAALANRLGIERCSISKCRAGSQELGPYIVLTIHLVSGISVEKIMELGGITRTGVEDGS